MTLRWREMDSNFQFRAGRSSLEAVPYVPGLLAMQARAGMPRCAGAKEKAAPWCERYAQRVPADRFVPSVPDD
jgi:hypothetical protein